MLINIISAQEELTVTCLQYFDRLVEKHTRNKKARNYICCSKWTVKAKLFEHTIERMGSSPIALLFKALNRPSLIQKHKNTMQEKSNTTTRKHLIQQPDARFKTFKIDFFSTGNTVELFPQHSCDCQKSIWVQKLIR